MHCDVASRRFDDLDRRSLLAQRQALRPDLAENRRDCPSVAVFLRGSNLTVGEDLEFNLSRSEKLCGTGHLIKVTVISQYHLISECYSRPSLSSSMDARRVGPCSSATLDAELLQKVRHMEAATEISAGNEGLGADVAPGQESGADLNRLPQVLDLTQAQNLRDGIAARLSEGPLVLDASAVERMSTPCTQVLLAAGRAADLAGSPFQIFNASDVFRTALADLGLQAEFKNWMV
jgi:chemotaxis protein CheX